MSSTKCHSENVSLPAGKEPVLRIVPMPADTNIGGSIFGGWLLSQIDIAGAVVAIQRAKGRVVTVAVNSVDFHQPVFVGDLVSCYAEVVKVGNTSITVDVDVYVQRNPEQAQCINVTKARLTYVALDSERRPRTVPAEG